MPTDKQLIASNQPYELKTIARRYKIPMKELRVIMSEVEHARSRKEVYKEIEKRGWEKGKGKVEVESNIEA